PTSLSRLSCLFFTDPSPTEIYTISLHDALPISVQLGTVVTGIPMVYSAFAPRQNETSDSPMARSLGMQSRRACRQISPGPPTKRSEEHTSELQSLTSLVCRLLLEKKKQLLYPPPQIDGELSSFLSRHRAIDQTMARAVQVITNMDVQPDAPISNLIASCELTTPRP